MSGGSYNYLYLRVEEVATDPRVRNGGPVRRAFAKHLDKVAEAMRAIEWVDSCDSSDDTKEILACLGPYAELEELISTAKELTGQLIEATKVAELAVE